MIALGGVVVLAGAWGLLVAWALNRSGPRDWRLW